MSFTRVDAWTEQEDSYLANMVLEYVREGETQLKAFEDAGDRLDRSRGACGYRWNTVLREHYKEKLRIARRIRRGQKVEID